MPRFSRRPAGLVRSVLLALPIALAGCDASSPLKEAGVSALTPPASWKSADPSRPVAAGRVLAAWDGPNGSSLVVVRSLPAPRTGAKGLADELRHRLANMPGLTIESAATERIGSTEAARVEVVAPGTGDALAPTGLGRAIAPEGKVLVPTHRVSLGFPLESGTVWLLWHYPESARDSVAPDVEATIRGLVIRDPKSSSSSS